MRIIAWSRLREFAREYPDALVPLKAWRALIERRTLRRPQDMKALFGANVDFVGGHVTIFDIGGNKYRISATVRFDIQIVFIRHVMTHREYDRRNADGTL